MSEEELPPTLEPETLPPQPTNFFMALGYGLLFLGIVIGFIRLSALLVTIPPLNWIPSGRPGPASGLLHHLVGSTPVYWLLLLTPIVLLGKWRQRSKLQAMGPGEKAEARRQKGRLFYAAIPCAPIFLWCLEGSDALKGFLAFMAVFVLLLGVAVPIYRWRHRKNDEPPGVKVI